MVMEITPERRAKWTSSIAEGARQAVSSAIGQMEAPDDPEVRAALRPLVEKLLEVHRELQDKI